MNQSCSEDTLRAAFSFLQKGDKLMIRKAVESDLDRVSGIYDEIHEEEKANRLTTGWLSGIYPVRETAETALERGDLFVFEEGLKVLASAIINQSQVEVYKDGKWLYNAPDSRIMVLHTLTVSPKAAKQGIGRAFVAFYEAYARENGCTVLRIDTNAKNTVARSFYQKLGFREAGIVPCVFNGIPGVNLVLLEKSVTSG